MADKDGSRRRWRAFLAGLRFRASSDESERCLGRFIVSFFWYILLGDESRGGILGGFCNELFLATCKSER